MLRGCIAARDDAECALRCYMLDQRLVITEFLHAVQAASDALLAGGIVGKEVNVDVGPHAGVHLGGVDDFLHLSIHHERRAVRLCGGGEHPHAPALRAEGGAIAWPYAVAVMDADVGLRRPHAAPGLGHALLDRLLDGGVNSGLGLGVRLGYKNGTTEFGVPVRIVIRGFCLKQVAVGQTDVVDRDSHNYISPF